MLEIDGGDGGGQLLRTALSLGAVTETAFEMTDIRGTRPDPGLKPQHLTGVELVAELSGASVEGAELGADSLRFEPGTDWTTEFAVDVGTAGSITLLFDTVLPIGAMRDEPLSVTATGGTDVKWSPTLAYLRRVKLPLLSRFGLAASVAVDRRGFYPAGGGEATLRTRPSSLSPIELTERGRLELVEIVSVAAEALADQEVAERQAEHASERLETAGHPATVEQTASVESDSPGSALLLRGVYQETLLGVDELGERGRPSEEVADLAVDAFETVHDGPGAVDRHMADQLVGFLALAGGEVRIPTVTDHVESNVALVDAFGAAVELDRRETGDGAVLRGERVL
jgi:RNA 3'-terminal phosphate cyclase (ATP)